MTYTETTETDAYGSTIKVGSYVQDISSGREGNEGDVLKIRSDGTIIVSGGVGTVKASDVVDHSDW